MMPRCYRCILLAFLYIFALCACSSPVSIVPSPSATDFTGRFLLDARVFQDSNANGQWDSGESPLEGMRLVAGELECTTNLEGNCSLGELPRGLYNFQIEQTGDFPFRIHHSGHVYPLEDGINIILNDTQTAVIALTQGVFTTPFKGKPPIDRYYDHEPSSRMAWWNEPDHQCDLGDPYCRNQPIGTDQHSGTDFGLTFGDPVLAAAPGEVIAVNGPQECNSVVIYHGFYQGSHLLSGYSHLLQTEVEVEQRVGRGEVIGRVGDVCTPGYPHLHFDVFSLQELEGAQIMDMIDPFHSSLPLPDGYWERSLGNLTPPVWVEGALPIHQMGWWTVENQPVNP